MTFSCISFPPVLCKSDCQRLPTVSFFTSLLYYSAIFPCPNQICLLTSTLPHNAQVKCGWDRCEYQCLSASLPQPSGLTILELYKIRRRPPPIRQCAYTSADLSLTLLFSPSLSLVHFQQRALQFSLMH